MKFLDHLICGNILHLLHPMAPTRLPILWTPIRPGVPQSRVSIIWNLYLVQMQAPMMCEIVEFEADVS